MTFDPQTYSPLHRPRRLRISAGLRSMVSETSLTPSDFIAPLFVRHGSGIRKPIKSMPGQFQLSIDQAVLEAKEILVRGIPAVILFGIPDVKDPCGSENCDYNGIVPLAIRAIKSACPGLIVITDMCFCEYTDHGHCGVINTPGSSFHVSTLPEGYLLNDPTLELLAKASVVHAACGADIIAPSGMIDGMIGAIRQALDQSSASHVSVMSYAAKYASGFYGPFRDAAESTPMFGDRHQYQMHPGNSREAMKEVALDVAEGADILMVKPAMPYLDIVHKIRSQYDLPVAAYQVSGEFAMIHAAASNGWIDLERCAIESLTCIKRAGADLILTYFAKDAAEWITR